MNWNTLCKGKRLGGLGIGRITDKNSGLLAKWVWRFGKEVSSLWKSIICAKYEISSSRLVWEGRTSPSTSNFMRAVGDCFMEGSNSAKILEKGLKVVIGKGNAALFWYDISVDVNP